MREDRLLPHVDAWLAQPVRPENIQASPRSQIVNADAEGHREDPMRSPGPRRRSSSANANSPSTSTDSRPASPPTSSPLG